MSSSASSPGSRAANARYCARSFRRSWRHRLSHRRPLRRLAEGHRDSPLLSGSARWSARDWYTLWLRGKKRRTTQNRLRPQSRSTSGQTALGDIDELDHGPLPHLTNEPTPEITGGKGATGSGSLKLRQCRVPDLATALKVAPHTRSSGRSRRAFLPTLVPQWPDARRSTSPRNGLARGGASVTAAPPTYSRPWSVCAGQQGNRRAIVGRLDPDDHELPSASI